MSNAGEGGRDAAATEWARLERAVENATLSLGRWSRLARESEEEVVRLRRSLEELAAQRSDAPDVAAELKRLKAENALLRSRMLQAQKRISGLMQRLAALHQHVVRDIDDVVDHRLADRRQPRGHLRWRGLDLDAADHTGRIARAKLGAIDRDAGVVPQIVGNPTRFVAGDCHSRLRHVEGQAAQHGGFAGDADVSQAIGPIARDL